MATLRFLPATTLPLQEFRNCGTHNTHTDELLVAYLPGPGILVEADSYSSGSPNTPPPSPAPPNAVSLFDNIQRLKLNVRTIAPIHGRGAVPFAEFRKFLGK
jgi:hypothetical protein